MYVLLLFSLRKQVFWWLCAGVVITLVVMLVLILSVRYSRSISNNANTDLFQPIETVLIRFPFPFCQRLSIDSTHVSLPVVASLLLLNETPLLDREISENISTVAKLLNSYYYSKRYLYPGSNASYSACYVTPVKGAPVTFYLVKGDDNFSRWKAGVSNSYIRNESIVALCESNSNSTFTYEVEAEDQYYFIFKSNKGFLSTVGITYVFDFILYQASNNTIMSMCFILLDGLTSCSLEVPLTFEPVVLLSLDLVENDTVIVDTYFKLEVECDIRVWLYVVIAISAFILVGFLVESFIVTVYLCLRRYKKSESPPDEVPLTEYFKK